MKHMNTIMLTTAFSMILRDWYDFAATISGPREMNYAMSTGSDSLTIFMFTMPEGVRNAVEEFGLENLRPGDVLITNDPYRVGLHVNDVSFIRPVFHDNKIVSFVAVRAHQLDIGGTVPGGFSATKRNVYETGLVIAPTLLYRNDKPVRTTFNLIFDNTRYGALLLPDIKSLYQSLLLGERLLLESLERYGLDAYLGAIRYSCDVSADAMRAALRAKIPDGVYEAEDGIDADGVDESLEYRVKVKLVKAGDKVEVDFSGTSAQARTSINCRTAGREGRGRGGVQDADRKQDANIIGLFPRHRHRDPAWHVLQRDAAGRPDLHVLGILADLVAGDLPGIEQGAGRGCDWRRLRSLMLHNGNGMGKDGRPWLTVGNCGGEHGPWGGTKVGDGDSYTVFHASNNLDPATEAVESDIPVVVMRKEYIADTAGPGANRGGAAVRRDTLCYRWRPSIGGAACEIAERDWREWRPCRHDAGRLDVSARAVRRCRRRPRLAVDAAIYRNATPVVGMLDPETKCLNPNGAYFYYAAQPVWRAKAGTSFRFQTGGGGGWGNPFDRDPERVLRDVRDEYVSIEGALRDYGVVVMGDPINDPENLSLDIAATSMHRNKRGKPEDIC